MNSPRHCAACGAEISASSPEGLCPKCMLGRGLDLIANGPTTLAANAPTVGSGFLTPFTETKLRYFGDYELLDEIARGGMGVVFRARQVSLNRLVAIKLITAGALATEDLVKRFKAEAEAAASLSHPNIVPIFEIGEHQGQHYFSMGLIEGPNLRQALEKVRNSKPDVGKNNSESPYTPRDAAQLLRTVARAVHYAHQRGVLHRDIKPSNILLDREGTPHLTDFGLAKLVEKENTLTETNAILGTPAYMAPEQARGDTKNVTTAADVYGLGAVLYETLTGSPPFGGGTSLETIRQVLDQEPRRPSFWNPSIDRDLETICLKCLQKEPMHRYSSAAGFSDDLDRWLRSETIEARRATAFERGRKWVRRRPAVAALTASLLIAFVFGVAGIGWQWRRAESERQVAEQSAQALRLNSYASEMNDAFEAFRNGSIQRARELIARQNQPAVAELRGFEWRWLWAQTQPRERAIIPLAEKRRSIAFDFLPDGTRFLTFDEMSLRIWDTATLSLVISNSHPFGYHAAFSRDGKIIITTDTHDKHVRLLSADTGSEIARYYGHSLPVVSAVLSSNRTFLASAAGHGYSDQDGEVFLWDAESKQHTATLDSTRAQVIYRVALSPDDRILAAGTGSGDVLLWDTSTKKRLRSLTGHRQGVLGLAFLPDNRHLVTASLDRTVRLWDMIEQREIKTLGFHEKAAAHVAISSDGTRAVTTGYDHAVRVWDLANMQALGAFFGHEGRTWGVAIHPDGEQIGTIGLDGTARLWQMPTEADEWQLNLSGWIFGFSSSTPLLLGTEADWQIRVWDVATRKTIYHEPGSHATWVPGSQKVVFHREGKLLELDPRTREERQLLDYGRPMEGLAVTVCSADNRYIAWGQPDHAMIYQRVGARAIRLETSAAGAHALSFSPDGSTLATTAAGGQEIHIWSSATGNKIKTLSGFPIGLNAITFSPDGQTLAAIGKDFNTRVFTLATGSQFSLHEDEGEPTVLAFAPDGRTLAVGTFEGSIKFWNIATRQQVASFQAGVSYFHSLRFAPDGSAFASANGDRTVRVWRAPTFAEIEKGRGLPAERKTRNSQLF